MKKQLIMIVSMCFCLNREANAVTEPGINEVPPVPLPTVPSKTGLCILRYRGKTLNFCLSLVALCRMHFLKIYHYF